MADAQTMRQAAEETIIDIPIEQALLAINTVAPAEFIAQV
jgi:hypothetical protein